MSGIQSKLTMHAKTEDSDRNQGESQPIETYPDVAEVMEFADKDVKTATKNTFRTFKREEQ